MSDLIKSLIDEREEELRLAKEKKEKEEAEALEKLLAGMKEYLGDFYTFLEERYNRTGEKYVYTYETNNGVPTKIFYKIPAIPEESLAPIVVKWGHRSTNPNYIDRQNIFSVGSHSYPDLKEALRAARESYPKYLEDRREERLKEFRREFPAYHDLTVTEEQALKLIEDLISEYPDLEAEGREKFSDWKEFREKYIADQESARLNREAQEAKRAQIAKVYSEYVSRLAEHLKTWDEVYQTNKEAAEEIQAIADLREYKVYKLTYAIMADYFEDGESSRELETRSVWVKDMAPDPLGFWDVNKGKKTKIFNPVTLEVETVKPSSGIFAIKETLYIGIDIFFAPDVTDEEISGLSDLFDKISPLPDEPQIPDELRSRYDRSDLIRAARNLIETGKDEERDEVPF